MVEPQGSYHREVTTGKLHFKTGQGLVKFVQSMKIWKRYGKRSLCLEKSRILSKLQVTGSKLSRISLIISSLENKMFGKNVWQLSRILCTLYEHSNCLWRSVSVLSNFDSFLFLHIK